MRIVRRTLALRTASNLLELSELLETMAIAKKFYRGHATCEEGTCLVFITNQMLNFLKLPRNRIYRLFNDETFAVCVCP